MQNEYEMSCYNLDEADIEDQRKRFDIFDAEARRMLAKRLPVPAYDHLLKLSHTFNILDARGAVGVTERANRFATMRVLAKEVTGRWQRGHKILVVNKSLGFRIRFLTLDICAVLSVPRGTFRGIQQRE